MKKWLALLLVFAMCISLIGCSSGGGSSLEDILKKETENDEVDEDAAFLVGDWACVTAYSYFGGTKILQVEYAELKSDGTFKTDNGSKKWKYSAKDKTLSMSGSARPLLEIDGQVVAQTVHVDEWEGWYFRVVEDCPVCSNICVGTWEQLTDYPERTTADFRDDGTMTINGEEHTWKSICGADAHFIEVSDYGVVRIDPHAAIISLMDCTFYRNNELTFIEITPDNWTEYFSADFMYNFDMHYHTEKTTVGDEWEQKVVQSLSIWPVLKWGENLATTEEVMFMGDRAQLMVEYSFEEGTQSFTLDDQGNVIPGEITQEYHDRYTDTMYIEPIRWYNEGNDTVKFAGDISGWYTNDISQPITVKIPKRIQRMKGWIAVKDINAIPEPVQPSPEEGHNIGDMCHGEELPIITGDGISESTYDPTKTGKVTVINFWGTWCAPSLEGLYQFDALASEYADDVTVVAVHSQTESQSAPKFISENFSESKIIFLSDIGPDEYTSEYYNCVTGSNNMGYPYTVVIGKDGVITHIFPGSPVFTELKIAVEEALS